MVLTSTAPAGTEQPRCTSSLTRSPRARTTLHSLLPWESASKEVDAATLAVIRLSTFAVADEEELTEKTRSKSLNVCRVATVANASLRDGHQTVLEDRNRLYYEPSELKIFRAHRVRVAAFLPYLLLDAHYRDEG